MLVLFPAQAVSSEPAPALQVKVAEPYVEVHTGPGRGYPVFHVVERHAPLTLLFQRAGWIKVETPRGRIGWVPRKALLKTLDGTGETPELQHLGYEDFTGGALAGIGAGGGAGRGDLTGRRNGLPVHRKLYSRSHVYPGQR